MTFLPYLRHFLLEFDVIGAQRPPADYPHRLLKTLWTTARETARGRAIPLMLNDMGRRRCHLLAKEAPALIIDTARFFL